MAASGPVAPDTGETTEAATASSVETGRPSSSPSPSSAPPGQKGTMPRFLARATAGIHVAWPFMLDVLPSLAATMMSNALILPKPSARWLGPLSFLTYPFIHLFYYPNPSRTIGGQFELFCIGLFGGTIGCALSFLIVACAVWADERYVYHHHSDQPRVAYASSQARTIGAMGMLILTFGAAYIQSYVPRMKPGTRICLFDMIWIITMGATEIKAATFLDLFWPSLCSGGVCLLATMLIRPKTANQVVVQQLTTFVNTVDQILIQTATDFFHPVTGSQQPRNASPKLISLRLTLLKTLTSIGGTFHAASYEFSYARIAARQYAVVLPVLGRIRTWIACGMGLDVAFRAPVPAPMFGGKGLGAFARPVVPRSDPLPSLPLPGQRRMLARMLAEHVRARQSNEGSNEDEDPAPHTEFRDHDHESGSSSWLATDEDVANATPALPDRHDPWSHGRATFEQFEAPVMELIAALHSALGTIAKAVAITTGSPPPGMVLEKPPPASFGGRVGGALGSAARRTLQYFHLPTPPTQLEKEYAASLESDTANEQVALHEALETFGCTFDVVFAAQFRRSALVHAAARAAAEKAANAGACGTDHGAGPARPRGGSSDPDNDVPEMDANDAQAFLDHLAVFDPDMYAVASLLVSLLELAHEVSSFLALTQRGVKAWLAHKSRRIHLPFGRLAAFLPSRMSELGPAVLWSGLDEHDTNGIPRSGVSQGRGGPEATFTQTVVEEGLLDDELLADADALKAHQAVAAAVAVNADDADIVAPTCKGSHACQGSRAERRGDDQRWMQHDPDTLFSLDPDAQFVNRARVWEMDDEKGTESYTGGPGYKLWRKLHAWARSPRILSQRLALSRWIRSVRRSRHIKFALKLAAGNTLLALPNWCGGNGRRWFVNDRAQWIIITYVWCLETSTAATLMISMQRMAATIMGAFTGVIIYEISRGNGVGLGACMAVVELISAYFLTQTWATSFGIVFGVTYSIVALIPYLDLEYKTVVILGWNRGYQIFLGIVAAMLVNLTIWPYHARSKLARHVGGLARDLGGYYLAISRHMMQAGFASSSVVTTYFASREAQLGARLGTCRALLALVTSEISLVPDPLGIQVQLLGELQVMADRLTGLRLCRDHGLRHVRRAAVGNVMELRRAFIASLLLCLWSAGQALSTRSALPQFLPSPRIHLRALTLGLQQQIVLLELGLKSDQARQQRKRKAKHMTRSSRLSPRPSAASKIPTSPIGKTKSSSPESAHPRFSPLRRHRTAPIAASEPSTDGPLHPSHLWPDLPRESSGPLSRLGQSRTTALDPNLGSSDFAWGLTSAMGTQDPRQSPTGTRHAQRPARRWSFVRNTEARPSLTPILDSDAPATTHPSQRHGRRRANTDSAALPAFQPLSPAPSSKLGPPLTLARTAIHATPSPTSGRTVHALRRPSEPGSIRRPSWGRDGAGGAARPSLMGAQDRAGAQGRAHADQADPADTWEDSPRPAGHAPRPHRPSKREQALEAAVLFLLAEHVLLSEIVEATEEVVRLCRLMLGEATFVDPTIVPIPAPPPASSSAPATEPAQTT